MTIQWKLVPVDPSEAQVRGSAPEIEPYWLGVRRSIYADMLRLAPHPSDEDVDAMCRMMWGDSAHWSKAYDGAREFPVTAAGFSTAHVHRESDRARMRAFLDKLNGAR